jgi:hypothetical protein
MTERTFSATFLIHVDENNNILGSYSAAHEEDVHDLVLNTFYDVDDVEIANLVIKERT